MTDQPRHIHEADTDERADLLAENKRLAERCEQLEAALRGMVERAQLVSPLDFGIHVDKSRTHTTHCLICGYPIEDAGHREDCPVVLAKALLGAE